jgi:hypothetical protein
MSQGLAKIENGERSIKCFRRERLVNDILGSRNVNPLEKEGLLYSSEG